MSSDFFKNINNFLYKMADVLRKHYLLVVILVFSLSLASAGFIFYRYVWLIVKLEPEVQDGGIEIKEDVYNAILENISQREKRFLESKNKIFPDIFSESR